MEPQHYKLVFSVADSGYREWWFPAAGLIFILVGIFVLPILFEISWLRWSPEAARIFRLVWIVFMIFWVVCAVGATLPDYLDARSKLADGEAAYVAGPVEHFVPMPAAGHAEESFDVNGVSFHYSDFTVMAGFNNSSSHGGPIHEGLPVHIWYENKGGYTGNEILKLEIAEK